MGVLHACSSNLIFVQRPFPSDSSEDKASTGSSYVVERGSYGLASLIVETELYRVLNNKFLLVTQEVVIIV